MRLHLNYWLTLLCWTLGFVSVFLVYLFPALLNTFIFSGQLSVLSSPLLTEQHEEWRAVIILFLIGNLTMAVSAVWSTFALANKQRGFVLTFRVFLLSIVFTVCVDLYESYLYFFFAFIFVIWFFLF